MPSDHQRAQAPIVKTRSRKPVQVLFASIAGKFVVAFGDPELLLMSTSGAPVELFTSVVTKVFPPLVALVAWQSSNIVDYLLGNKYAESFDETEEVLIFGTQSLRSFVTPGPRGWRSADRELLLAFSFCHGCMIAMIDWATVSTTS